MQGLFPLRTRTQSLFIRLLISFLAVVILLAAIHYLSFTLYQSRIRSEVIRYNDSSLDNMTESFEKHFRLLNDLVMSFYFNEKVQQLNTKTMNYYTADQVRREIQTILTNKLLYIDDLVLYFKTDSFIIEKSGTTRASTMFGKFYKSDSYPASFWENEFAQPYSFRIYPADRFSESVFKDVNISKGTFFPVIVKNNLYPNLYMTAFLDADKMIEAYNPSLYRNLYIIDGAGRLIYASGEPPESKFPAFDYSKQYLKAGKNYYFYKKGPATGLTYVNIVPDVSITSQISRLNATLITLLIAAVALGIAASIIFSMNIHNPVKQIIESIQQLNMQKPLKSRIKEFKVINEQMRNFVNTNQEINRDLREKNSYLRYYAYINKLKKIYSKHIFDLKELFADNSPFIFILVQLSFKPGFHNRLAIDTEKATYFIKEYLEQTVSEYFPDTCTFQIENDRILSLVFAEDCEAKLAELVHHIKQVLQMDRESVLATIAVGTQHHRSSEFTSAYEQVVGLLDRRRFADETQIVRADGETGSAFALSASQEREFAAYLNAGNGEALKQFVLKLFEQMEKKRVYAADFRQTAGQLAKMALKAAGEAKEEHDRFDEFSVQLSACYSTEQLLRLFDHFLDEAVRIMNEKREEHDPVTDFIVEYINGHFAEEITLNTVADKMNLTGGYLSSYFKEKTGKNFIDYLNEVRIQKARELLLQTNLKIQDIAAKAGYQNMNSFNRMFKKFTGLTPREYRHTKTDSDSQAAAAKRLEG